MTGVVYAALSTLMFDLARRRTSTLDMLFPVLAGTLFLILSIGAFATDFAEAVGII